MLKLFRKVFNRKCKKISYTQIPFSSTKSDWLTYVGIIGSIGGAIYYIKNLDTERYRYKVLYETAKYRIKKDEKEFKKLEVIKVCESRDKDTLKKLVDNRTSNWQFIFQCALNCKTMEIANWILHEKLIDIDDAMYTICEKGNVYMFDSIINNFIKNSKQRQTTWGEECVYSLEDDLDNALYHACIGGNEYIINKLINLDDNLKRKSYGDLDTNLVRGLYGACVGGHFDLVMTMVSMITDIESINYNNVLHFACLGGNIDIINYAIENGAYDFDYNLDCAKSEGHEEIVKLFLDKYRTY